MKTRSFPPWPGQKEIEEKTEQHASSLHRTHPVNRAIMKPTTVLATFAALAGEVCTKALLLRARSQQQQKDVEFGSANDGGLQPKSRSSARPRPPPPSRAAALSSPSNSTFTTKAALKSSAADSRSR